MAKKDITYTDAVAEIESILKRLDSSSVDIDALGEDVKRASELIKLCKSRLHKAEKEVSEAFED